MAARADKDVVVEASIPIERTSRSHFHLQRRRWILHEPVEYGYIGGLEWSHHEAQVLGALLRVGERRQQGDLFARYDDGTVTYASVDAFAPNALGIASLSGNVREWVSDWYAAGVYAESPEENPTGPAEGELRVVRGGSWASAAIDLRVSSRHALPPDTRSPVVGFRCAFDE